MLLFKTPRLTVRCSGITDTTPNIEEENAEGTLLVIRMQSFKARTVPGLEPALYVIQDLSYDQGGWRKKGRAEITNG